MRVSVSSSFRATFVAFATVVCSGCATRNVTTIERQSVAVTNVFFVGDPGAIAASAAVGSRAGATPASASLEHDAACLAAMFALIASTPTFAYGSPDAVEIAPQPKPAGLPFSVLLEPAPPRALDTTSKIVGIAGGVLALVVGLWRFARAIARRIRQPQVGI